MTSSPAKKKLVILGTGFGAFSLVKKVDTDLFDVTVISPRNHFLFTPLLPSTTVGTIEFRSIIEPIRTARPAVRYFQASCEGILADQKKITCAGALEGNRFEVSYDLLVIAVGATANTYGIPGVAEHAFFLRELSDSREIRQRIIECFEQAAQPDIPDAERRRLLTFVVVGGGPNGVEFAAELHDFLVEDIRRTYRWLSENVRIILLEAGDHILTSFDVALSDYTTKHFKRQNIDVRTGSLVTRVEKNTVFLKDGTDIPCGLVVWSTGIGATKFIQALPFPKDKTSRLIVDDFLAVTSAQDMYALGDCVVVSEKNLPATAQVAQQEGRYLARALKRRAKEQKVLPFEYRNLGMLAYVGEHRALADLSAVKGRGFLSFLFWRSAYLTRLVSMKNKLLVLFDWFKALVFGRDVSRF